MIEMLAEGFDNPVDLLCAKAAKKLEKHFAKTKAKFALIVWPDGMPSNAKALVVVASPDHHHAATLAISTAARALEPRS